jgi:hypothetical protein
MTDKEQKILSAIYLLLQTDCKTTIQATPGQIALVINTKDKKTASNVMDKIEKVKKP